jgi:predicted O-methyltransferase YrrM
MQLVGWCRPEQGRWYDAQVSTITNGVIVEVGVHGGMSLSYIVDTCVRNGNSIVAVDPWEIGRGGDDVARLRTRREEFQSFIERFGFGSLITVVQGFSVDAAARFANGSIDFAYIDAFHDYESVTRDMHTWYPKLKPGCTLAGDDYDWQSVESAVRDFTGPRKLKFGVFHGTWYFTKPR